MQIYFLIPVFNESLNLGLLYENLIDSMKENDKYFLFVDDCSTDDTVNKIHDLFGKEKYHIIKKQKNQGPGDSFNLGFEWILQHSQSTEDIIVTLEADNTSDIGILPSMISISNLGYDLVLASVYIQGGGFDKTTFIKKIRI